MQEPALPQTDPAKTHNLNESAPDFMNGEEKLQFVFELNHERVERMSEDVKLNFRH